jgi:hypothetical protein
MMETYARHIIYRRCPGDTFRPHISVATLREAVAIVDSQFDGCEYKVIDLEHLDLGDMLKAEACADLVARFRLEATA